MVLIPFIFSVLIYIDQILDLLDQSAMMSGMNQLYPATPKMFINEALVVLAIYDGYGVLRRRLSGSGCGAVCWN